MLIHAGKVEHEGTVDVSVVTYVCVGRYGPVYFKCVVAADACQEQDDAVFDEDVEEGEAESQKL